MAKKKEEPAITMEEAVEEETPVEEAAPVEEEVAEEPTEEPAEEPTEEIVDEPPDPETLKAEIERLKEAQKKAKEDAAYWRRQKAEARADYFKGREEKPSQTPQEMGPEPKQDDFDSYDEYTAALVDYRVEKRLQKWEADRTTKNEEQSYEERMRGVVGDIVAKGMEKYEDFEEVALDTTIPFTPAIIEALEDSDIKEDVAYYLGRNRSEVIKLSRMTPVRIAREVAKIEATIAETQEQNPETKKVSKAPPPIRPVSASHSVDKDPEKMTQKEFEAMREKQGAKPF